MNVGIIAIFTVTEIHDYDIRKRMTGTLEKSEYLSSKGRWCIEINDKSVPDSSKGITFGSSNHCGVRLPKHGSISNCHFSLNFDKENRLVIIDHSINGIEVKYGEQGAGLRDQSQCILNDPKLPPKLRQITIKVAGVMTCAVDVRLMLSSEESYTKFVKGFRDHCDKKSQDLAGGIQRATLHQTRHTPSPDQVSDIWLRWEVPKKGTLASIIRCWNTENGIERIVKAPSSKYDEAKWSRQVEFLTILKDHHHVVDILRFPSTSEGIPTQIEMKYLSGGSLEEPEDPSLVSDDPSDRSDAHFEFSKEGSDIFEDSYSEFSKEEVTCILAQCLSVLAKMHTKSPPIYHRDLTRTNILFNRRDSSGICVKVAGFGAATRKPEIGKGGDGAVYAVLDIWSLGLAVLGLINNDVRRLFHTRYRENWTQMDKSEDSLVQFLRKYMLQEDHHETKSAAECLEGLRAEGGIKPCGCSECSSCGGHISECEHEGVERPTTPDVQEESSNCSTPKQSKLADGQSEDSSNTPTTAHFETDMLPTTPDVGGSPTTSLFAALLEDSSVKAGEQVTTPASPADSSNWWRSSRIHRRGSRPHQEKKKSRVG
ncbi:unnamed protein product [Clonostachys chloroleuca]|uniref:EKC/KEOPS complex subunit BUD32 n=1 Tax=Clonostachys chloroleuca TaxID=1926264 RepID=A0AA35LS08_9HYPO|nr:unnamed protein product [Clonostachys chloroleuca]